MTAKSVHHRSPRTNKAKAPYNFVPLPEKVLTIEGDEKKRIVEGLNDKYYSERHTGYIDLEIKTETPLYTRCAYPSRIWAESAGYVDKKGDLKPEFDDNDKPKVTAVRECQDFFHHGDEKKIPIIPGSTLRGMTRSLVEILTYSKIFAVSNKKLMHRSLADGTLGRRYRNQLFDKIKGGYLVKENGDYKIRPAVEIDGKTFVQIPFTRNGNQGPFFMDTFAQRRERKDRNKSFPIWVKLKPGYSKADEICFNENDIPANEKPDYHKAQLVVSGDMYNARDREKSKKHECAIFAPDENAESIPISTESWRLFQDDLDLSRNDAQKPRKLDKNKLENLKKGEPIFYLVDENAEKPEDKLVFFGLAKMFRLTYPSSIQEFLDDDSRNQEILDMAESIFGIVDEKNKKMIVGRVFFTDAICATEDPFFETDTEGRFVPKILSSPKPTAFQLYLNQPDPNDAETLKSYYNKGETLIRGFKCYWHKNTLANNQEAFADEKQQPNIDNLTSKQHTIIKPVKKDVAFNKCRVYFENLSDIELGALLTALDLPQNMRHQIGMAKPYGLGSVKIIPTLVLQNRKTRYATLFDDNNTWTEGNDESLKKDFKGKFEKSLIDFCKGVYGREEIKSLLEIPRIRQLYTMLEWQPNPNLEEKGYCNLQYEEQGRKRLASQWRNRYVLPYPEHVNSGGSDGLSFDVVEIGSAENNKVNSERIIETKQESPRNHTFRTRLIGVKKKT